MRIYQIKNELPVLWNGEEINGVRHPKNIGDLWSDAELESVGLFRLQEADDPPADSNVVGSSVAVVDGKVKEINTLEAITYTPNDVRREAQRRINLLFPEWKQRNMNEARLELMESRIENGSLTTAELAVLSVLKENWAMIKAVRAASNVLEATDPIPLNYRDNIHWT